MRQIIALITALVFLIGPLQAAAAPNDRASCQRAVRYLLDAHLGWITPKLTFSDTGAVFDVPTYRCLRGEDFTDYHSLQIDIGIDDPRVAELCPSLQHTSSRQIEIGDGHHCRSKTVFAFVLAAPPKSVTEVIVGFDPNDGQNEMAHASLAMTNNIASNVGTGVALTVAYIPAIVGGVIADIVVTPMTFVGRLLGAKIKYPWATATIHREWKKELKKYWRGVFSGPSIQAER